MLGDWHTSGDCGTTASADSAVAGKQGNGRAPQGAANGAVGHFRPGLYLPLTISIFLADAFSSVFSPTETVRMPSR